jgi:hypothetical protein
LKALQAIRGTRQFAAADICEVPYHGNKRTEPIIPILADYDFGWTGRQMNTFVHLWNKGESIMAISERLQRHYIEVTCLLMQMELDGRVKARHGGLMGER